MDRVSLTCVCIHCRYEKEVLFYDLSDQDFRSGDLMSTNLEREKSVKNSECSECHCVGFEHKRVFYDRN